MRKSEALNIAWIRVNLPWINSCRFQTEKQFSGEKSRCGGEGGGGTLQGFFAGRLRHEVQPITLLYTI